MSTPRAFPRIQLSVDVRISAPNGAAYGRLRDMSVGGAGVVLKTQIASIGDTVELEIPHPTEGPLSLFGKVVRTASDGAEHFYGIQFFRQANASIFGNQERLNDAEKEQGSRRSHTRVARRIPVRYGTLGELRAILENLSLGGFALTLDTPMELNSEISIEIPHPQTGKLLMLAGKAVHVTPIDVRERKLFRIGFAFRFLSAEKRAELTQFLTDVLSMTIDES